MKINLTLEKESIIVYINKIHNDKFKLELSNTRSIYYDSITKRITIIKTGTSACTPIFNYKNYIVYSRLLKIQKIKDKIL